MKRMDNGRFQGAIQVQVSWRNWGLIPRACIYWLRGSRFMQGYTNALLERAAKRDGRPYKKTMTEDGYVHISFETK